MTRRVYADHAATTPIDPVALDAMIELQRDFYGNPSQSHSYGRAARAKLEEARATIARCVNAQPDEIYFTSGATEGNNWVIKGFYNWARRRRFPSDYPDPLFWSSRHCASMAISSIEHDSVRLAFEDVIDDAKGVWLKEDGVEDSFLGFNLISKTLKCDQNGLVPWEEFDNFMYGYENYMNAGALVSIILANNELGVIQDFPGSKYREIADSCYPMIQIHADATQAVGHIPVDVRALGVNALTASAHKFNGPKGVGFLYLNKVDETSEHYGIQHYSFAEFSRSLLDGGGQEFGRRSGTPNVPGIVAMAIALERNVERMAENTAKLKALEERLLGRLDAAGVDYVRNAPDAPKLPGFLSLAFPGHSAERLFHRLDLWGVAVSTGSACHGQSTEVSRVLKAIGLPDELAKATLRITLGKENTEEDVDYIADCLAKLTKEKK